MTRDNGIEAPAQFALGEGRRRVRVAPAGGVAPLQPVLAGKRDAHTTEAVFEIGERTTAHQRQRTTAGMVQASNQAEQGIVDMHTAGRVGKLDQCAIHIEKKGPVRPGRRQGGSSHYCPPR